MRVLLASFMFSALFVLPFSTAQADPIGDDTKCSVVREIMDPASPDMRKVGELRDYISRIMQIIDKSYAARGKREIFLQLTDQDRYRDVAIASTRCREHSDMTVQQVAIETYEDLRATRDGVLDTFGLSNQK